MKIDSTWSVDALLDEALKVLMDVESGETFTVSDLFRGFEWKRLPMGTRIKLGSQFFEVTKDVDSPIIPTEKTAQNQQKYTKK